MIERLQARWPQYLMEGAGLGLFMLSASLFTVLLFHPALPMVRLLPSALARRGLMGLAMAATAAGLIYSPWGRSSGAYLNPAFNLAQLRLGNLAALDALFYSVAQVLGGLAGMALSMVAFGSLLAHPDVAYVVTVPGPSGRLVAFAAELLISFVLMASVLTMTARPAWSRYTGLLAAAWIGLFITFEAPLSGMSLNPARTLASALPANRWDGIWIYLTAPVLGMLAAAELRLLAGALAAPARSLSHALRGNL